MYQYTAPLGFRVYEDAIILPQLDGRFATGGAVSSRGDLIPDTTLHEGIEGRYAYDVCEVVDIDADAIYVGYFFSCWGHVITDVIKKLWFLSSPDGQRLVADGAQVCYLPEPGNKLEGVALEVCRLLGIDTRKMIPIRSLTRYRRLYVPDNSFMDSADVKLWTDTYCSMIRAIREAVPVPAGSPERIYLSRRRFSSWQREMGERELEEAYRREGFTVIYPERLSIEEQIGLLRGCRELVSTDGSVAHNVVFCEPGVRQTILLKSDFINPYQLAIDEAFGIGATLVPVHRSVCNNPLTPWMGPFYLSATPQLEQHLGHLLPRRPLWAKPSWWWYLVWNRWIRPVKEATYPWRVRLRQRLRGLFAGAR